MAAARRHQRPMWSSSVMVQRVLTAGVRDVHSPRRMGRNSWNAPKFRAMRREEALMRNSSLIR